MNTVKQNTTNPPPTNNSSNASNVGNSRPPPTNNSSNASNVGNSNPPPTNNSSNASNAGNSSPQPTNNSSNASNAGNSRPPPTNNSSNASNVGNSSNVNNKLSEQEKGIMARLNNIISNNMPTSSSIFGNNKVKVGNDKGKQGDGENIVVNTDNYIIILGVFFALVLLVLLFFLSKTFNVGKTLEHLKMFERYQKITNFSNRKGGNTDITLKDVVISSSYNSCHSGNQILGYTSENVLKQILKSGARYIELNVFASNYGNNAIPVVSQGYKQGQWKLMLNTTTFEDVINVVAKNAFTISSEDGGCPNPNDPLFLGLNLSTGYNLHCLDLMHNIILDYLSDYLLDSKYAYQFNYHLHDIPLKQLQNKIIIFASSGFEGSNMEELVNYQWEDDTIFENNSLITMERPTSIESFINRKNYSKMLNNKMKVEKRLNNLKKNKPFTFEDTVKYSDITRGKVVNNTQSKLEKFNSKLKEEFGDILDGKNNKNNKNTKSIDNRYKEEMDDVNPFDVLSDTENKKTKLIRISSKVMNDPAFNANKIREHNKDGLTLVVPHIEGDIITRNYNPNIAFELGCQFVAMNYSLVDENMDKYITKFENYGILEK